MYIRRDTPMWEWFVNLGVKVYDINTLRNNDNTDIFFIKVEDQINNLDIIKRIKKNDVDSWLHFLNS